MAKHPFWFNTGGMIAALLGFLLIGCPAGYFDSPEEQVHKKLDPWLDQPKNAYIRAHEPPTSCIQVDAGEEVCEWTTHWSHSSPGSYNPYTGF